MRKNKIIGAMLIATIIAAACSDSLEPNSTGGSQLPQTITLGINTPAETRLSHEYDANASILKVNWKQGDVVRVFGASTGYTDYTADADGTDGQPVAFTAMNGGTASGESFNIFYPADKAGTTWDATTLNMLGQIQTDAGETAHLADYTYLAKKAVDLNDPSGVQMEHQTAIIRFDVGVVPIQAKQIRSLTLSTQDGESLNTLQGVGETSEGTSKQLTLAVNAPNSETGVFYMAVLPSMLDAGKPICISLVRIGDNGLSNLVTVGSGKKYEAGYVYNTQLFTSGTNANFSKYNDYTTSSEPEIVDGVYLIKKPGNLKWLIVNVNNGSHNSAGQKYKLTVDLYIDRNTPWTPIGTEANPFSGSFDGGGHTISGQMSFSGATQYAGLFGYVEIKRGTTASITNLHIAADMVGTDIETTDARNTYVGILGYLENWGTFNLQNCTYTGAIDFTFKEAPQSVCYVGTIGGNLTAMGGATTTIDRCQAIGSIKTSNGGDVCFTYDFCYRDETPAPTNSYSQITTTKD
ncbi:hypothetical protein D0T50_04875 [Bacteroides sp. 214]|uniref:hypothetical protein n=1 Tax=Bacteroides sp. 214 TaxID=2302935 RepID=UPI0013D64695|nr:hypothetical protein [Bacteroides sp. 214]NDW12222.1 hypothetical protein [Bacteroides sp. 214]